MNFNPFEQDKDITVSIRKVANGYVLRIYRPAKPYQSGTNMETHEMVYLSLEACLEFAKKFLLDPWEIQLGS